MASTPGGNYTGFNNACRELKDEHVQLNPRPQTLSEFMTTYGNMLEYATSASRSGTKNKGVRGWELEE